MCAALICCAAAALGFGAFWLFDNAKEALANLEPGGASSPASDVPSPAAAIPWNPIRLSSMHLPTPRSGTSAVWTGSSALVFGGTANGTHLSEILRFDPTTEQVTVMGARFPTGLTSTAAIWTGNHAVIFGGFTSDGFYSDQIFRYYPASDVLETSSATLPRPVTASAAVWTGKAAVVFGGFDATTIESAISIYDPVSDTIKASNASFPRPWILDQRGLAIATSVWDGNYAYLFGGYSPRGWTAQVLRYDPIADQIEYLSPTGSSWMVDEWGTGHFDGQGPLPSRMGYATGIWDGHRALLFGGQLYSAQTTMEPSYSDGILSFDPNEQAVDALAAWMPAPLGGTSAVWTGKGALLFGGADGTASSDQILVYSPSPFGSA